MNAEPQGSSSTTLIRRQLRKIHVTSQAASVNLISFEKENPACRHASKPMKGMRGEVTHCQCCGACPILPGSGFFSPVPAPAPINVRFQTILTNS